MRSSIVAGRRPLGHGRYCALVLGLLSACGHAQSPAVDPSTAHAAEPTAVGRVAQPSSAVNTPPGAESTAQTDQRSPDEQHPSPFHVLGELPGPITIYPVGDRAFLANEQRLALQLVGDDVVHDPKLERGLWQGDAFWESYVVTGIGGRWPDATWIATVHPLGRTGISRLRHWNGKAWTGAAETRDGEIVFGIQPWIGGRMLALVQAGMLFEASFRVLSGNSNVTLPVPSKPKVQESFCFTRVRVEAYSALPSGDVFIVGPACDDDGTVPGLAIETWAPGQKQGTLTAMPSFDSAPDVHVTAMAALAPNNVLVALRGTGSSGQPDVNFLLLWDGQHWTEQPVPIPSGVQQFWKGASGELFASGGNGSLWFKALDAEWTEIPLPRRLGDSAARTHVQSLWSPAAGDTWVIATPGPENTRSFLLHTHPGKGALPSPDEMAHKAQELRLPGPPTEYCETPFVLLYTLGKKAPPNYDYPATRAALKGNTDLQDKATFIEFEREGRRYFGAKVPDFDVGKRLSKLVKDKVPGSTPQLVCHDPLITRTLGIDLASGELAN